MSSPSHAILLDLLVTNLLRPSVDAAALSSESESHPAAVSDGQWLSDYLHSQDAATRQDAEMSDAEKLLYVILRTSVLGNADPPPHCERIGGLTTAPGSVMGTDVLPVAGCGPRCWLTPSITALVEGSQAMVREMRWSCHSDPVLYATVVPEPVQWAPNLIPQRQPVQQSSDVNMAGSEWVNNEQQDARALFATRSEPPADASHLLDAPPRKAPGTGASASFSIPRDSLFSVFRNECTPEVLLVVHYVLHHCVVGVNDPYFMVSRHPRPSPAGSTSGHAAGGSPRSKGSTSPSKSRLKRLALAQNPVIQEPYMKLSDEFLMRRTHRDAAALSERNVKRKLEEAGDASQVSFSRGLTALLAHSSISGTLMLRLQRLCDLSELPERQAALGSYGRCAMEALRHVLFVFRLLASTLCQEALTVYRQRRASFDTLLSADAALEPLRDNILAVADVFGVAHDEAWDASEALKMVSSATLLSVLFLRFSVRSENRMRGPPPPRVAEEEAPPPPFSFDAITFLLRAVFYPLHHMLQQWLTVGELSDPLDEFFVVPSPNAIGGFEVNPSPHRLPCFISESVAATVLQAGLSMRVLKGSASAELSGGGFFAKPSEPWISFVRSVTGVEHNASLSPPLPTVDLFDSSSLIQKWKEFYCSCDRWLFPSEGTITLPASTALPLPQHGAVDSNSTSTHLAASSSVVTEEDGEREPITVLMFAAGDPDSSSLHSEGVEANEEGGESSCVTVPSVNTEQQPQLQQPLLPLGMEFIRSERMRRREQRLEIWKGERFALNVRRRQAIRLFAEDVQQLHLNPLHAELELLSDEARYLTHSPLTADQFPAGTRKENKAAATAPTRVVVPLPTAPPPGVPPVILYPSEQEQQFRAACASAARDPGPPPAGRRPPRAANRPPSEVVGEEEENQQTLSILTAPPDEEHGKAHDLVSSSSLPAVSSPRLPTRRVFPENVAAPQNLNEEEAIIESVILVNDSPHLDSACHTNEERDREQDEESDILFRDAAGFPHFAEHYRVGDINDEEYFHQRTGPHSASYSRFAAYQALRGSLQKEVDESNAVDINEPAYLQKCWDSAAAAVRFLHSAANGEQQKDADEEGTQCSLSAHWAREVASFQSLTHKDSNKSSEVRVSPSALKDSKAVEKLLTEVRWTTEQQKMVMDCGAYYARLGLCACFHLTRRAVHGILQPGGALSAFVTEMLDVWLLQSPTSMDGLLSCWMPYVDQVLLGSASPLLSRSGTIVSQLNLALQDSQSTRGLLLEVRWCDDGRSVVEDHCTMNGLSDAIGLSCFRFGVPPRLLRSALSFLPADTVDVIGTLFRSLLFWKAVEQLVALTWRKGLTTGVPAVSLFCHAFRQVFYMIQEHVWSELSRLCDNFRQSMVLGSAMVGQVSSLEELTAAWETFLSECRLCTLQTSEFQPCWRFLHQLFSLLVGVGEAVEVCNKEMLSACRSVLAEEEQERQQLLLTRDFTATNPYREGGRPASHITPSLPSLSLRELLRKVDTVTEKRRKRKAKTPELTAPAHPSDAATALQKRLIEKVKAEKLMRQRQIRDFIVDQYVPFHDCLDGLVGELEDFVHSMPRGADGSFDRHVERLELLAGQLAHIPKTGRASLGRS